MAARLSACDPFADAGTQPVLWEAFDQLMAQPAVALRGQFPMSAPLSPVERAIVAGTGR